MLQGDLIPLLRRYRETSSLNRARITRLRLPIGDLPSSELIIVIRILGKRVSAILAAYYLGPDHPMKLRFFGKMRRATRYARLVVRYADIGWLSVDERDWVQRQVLATGFYEGEVWEALSKFAARSEVVWDVGAHVGSFAVRAMLDGRVREVHAFEPDPLNREGLMLNLALNNGQCVVHPYALSSRHEITRLYHGPFANTGLSSLAAPVSTEAFDVECRTIDDLVFLQGVCPPTLLKMDVEGWEHHVLQGASRLLSEKPPKAIVFEAECDESGRPLRTSMIDDLRKTGYRVRRIDRPYGSIESRENYLAEYVAPSSK